MTGSKRISLAPMIDKSEPRFRFLIRTLFPEMQIYTEMISSGAIIHGQRERFLDCEDSIALQIGTHCPEEAYQSVRIAREYPCGFNEYNLNAGCPSDRVQNRKIGAILMSDGPLVAEILAGMRQALRDTQQLCGDGPLPEVTIKHRLGIESLSISVKGEKQLYNFLQQVASHCDRLIVHARIAQLEGLNPKQNREIPPLDYPLVFQIRRDFAPLPVELNGGLKTVMQVEQVWQDVDGVMLGRVSYEDTWQLLELRRYLLEHGLIEWRSEGVCKRSELVERYCQYLAEYPSEQSISAQIWPLLSLWHSLPEARTWRRLLSPPYPKDQGILELAQEAHKYILELEAKYPHF